MYVCQCKGVTDRQVRGAVAEGCTTLRSVAAATGAATGCGGCIATIRDLVCGSCPSRVVDVACDDAVDLDLVEIGGHEVSKVPVSRSVASDVAIGEAEVSDAGGRAPAGDGRRQRADAGFSSRA